MLLLFIAIGAILGGFFLEEGGIVPGALLGYLLHREVGSRKQIAGLENQVGLLKERLRRMVDDSEDPAQEVAGGSVLPSEHEPIETFSTPAEEPPMVEPVEPVEVEALSPEPTPAFASPEQESDLASASESAASGKPGYDVLEEIVDRVKDFIRHTNLLVLIGVAVLFVGLAFLIKLAVENNLFPIELRLASAGLAGIALIAAGWRIAKTRPGYGVSLQGGGIAVLFLTVFASYRLYELIPSQIAFLMLVAITLLGSFIAVQQNAQILAVLSFIGGFLAPIITSTDSGNHVALFGYYAVLNLGILYMAWNRPWRVLHLTGFLFTFGIMTLWNRDSYTPEVYASAQPFLVLFFLMYLAIGLMYVIRHGSSTNRYLDSTLTFGLPVVVFGLQASFVAHFEYGLAWSSLAMGAVYALLAWILYRRYPEKLRLMVESFTGIGLALISMTIPFALNATWTGAGWALEGAALIWLGIRQVRPLIRTGGMLLIVAAGISFVYGLNDTSYAVRDAYRVLANPAFMGFMALSLSSIFGAYHIEKNRDRLRFFWEPVAGSYLMITGVIWWLIGGLSEIERSFLSSYSPNIMIGFAALTALGITLLGRNWTWPAFMRSALFLPFLLYFLMGWSGLSLDHLFANWGFVSWGIALPLLFYVLYVLEKHMSSRLAVIVHALSVWLCTIVLSIEGYWLFDQWAPAGSIWPFIGSLLAPLAAVFGIGYLTNSSIWPATSHKKAYLKVIAGVLLAGLFLMSLYASFNLAANPDPLSYIPVFNPLGIMLGFLALSAFYWYRTLIKVEPEFLVSTDRNLWVWGLALVAFVWMNATIGRTVHHWQDVPFDERLFEVSSFQTALSVCWTLLAVFVMAWAARREARIPWLVAGGLLAVVVVKLFTIDLSNLTTLHRVISFIVVGLLLLLIGYVAPAPPRRDKDIEPNRNTDS